MLSPDVGAPVEPTLGVVAGTLAHPTSAFFPMNYPIARRLLSAGLLAAALGLISACSEKSVDYPVPPEMGVPCSYCTKLWEDSLHLAQVRFKAEDGSSQVRYFDDFGCAVLWLKEHPQADVPGTRFWVTDWRSGAWIDARTAVYIRGQTTAQGYGIGAQWEPDPGGMTFEQASAKVIETQERTGFHPGQLAPAGAVSLPERHGAPGSR